MDYLKGQLDKIQQQLGGLNASQKMLTGSLVAIMVMTLLWWGRYAGQAEMEPVLPQPFQPGDIAKVTGHLKSIGIPTQLEGDRVLVPADRRDEALAALAFAEVMPDNFVSGFDEISKQMSPWDPQSKTEHLFKESKQRTLQNVIRRFPGVKDATVLITPPGKLRLGAANEARASIQVIMKDGGVGTRKLADAAANLVAGAEQDLKVSKTSVVIGLKRYMLTPDGEGVGGSDEIGELVAGHERRYEEKIQSLYHFIEGLTVRVSVNVDTVSTQTQSKSHDPQIQQKELETIQRNESEPVPSSGGPAEPGALPNTGASIDELQRGAQATAGERTVEETKTKFENFANTKTESSLKPAGDYKVVSATVRVPRSYFVGIYKAANGSSAEPPSAAALQPVIDAEYERIRADVVGCTDIADPAKVTVSMFNDATPALLAAATAAPSESITASLGTHGKEIAIGLLAVVSLFMVTTMVRKSAPAPVIAAVAEPRETPHLEGQSEVAGFAGEGDPMLDGMELDEDAVRTQQMLDQVQTMVGENPDAAANLVKRWLNRT